MKKLFSIIILLLVSNGLLFSKSVSVLSWWNYLDKNWVSQELKNRCGVNLALQEYTDNTTFVNLFNQYKFDIAIFESTAYPLISKKLNPINSKLHEMSDKYTKFIKNQFNSHIQNNNMSVFFISDIVFLYNPKNISISSNDSITSIINKLKKNNSRNSFVILDDPNMISEVIYSDTKHALNLDNFNKIFNYSNLIFANDYNSYKNLGVFMTWSGEANFHKNEAKKEGIKLKIVTIPKYAYTTFDVVLQLNPSNDTSCVANLISSKKFMKRLQKEVLYYSPYDNNNKNNPSYFLYKDFVQNGINNKLKWVFPNQQFIKKTNQQWQDILLNDGL